MNWLFMIQVSKLGKACKGCQSMRKLSKLSKLATACNSCQSWLQLQINNKKNKPAPGNAHYQGPIDLAHYYIKVRNNRSRCVIFLFRITALSKEMERSVWSSVWEDDFSVRAWPSTFQPSCSTLLHLPPTISRWLSLSYSISLLLPPTNSRWLTFIHFI